MKTFSIMQSKTKQMGLIGLTLLMTLLSLFCLGLLVTRQCTNLRMYVLTAIGGVIGTPFFGFASYFLVKQLMHPKEILIVSEEGIIDQSSAVAAGFIPWTEIESIYRVEITGQVFIGIQIKDEDKFLKRMKPLARNAMKANKKLKAPLVNVTLQASYAEFEETLKCLQDNLKIYKERLNR